MGYQRDLETTVHMRLYSVKKMHVFFYLIIFSTIMFLAVLIGVLGPPVLSRNTQYATDNLPQGRNLYNGFYKITSFPVLLFQKEIWFSAVIHLKNSDRFAAIPLSVNISILCRTYPDNVVDESRPDVGDVVAIYKYQKNVTLICMGGKACNELQLIHIARLNCAAYTFKVRFLGLLVQEDDNDFAKFRRDGIDMDAAGADSDSFKDNDILVKDIIGSDTENDDAAVVSKNDDISVDDTDNGDNTIAGQNNNDTPANDDIKTLFGPVMEEENKEINRPVIPNFVITEIEFITQTRNPTFAYFEMLSRFVAFLAAFGLFFAFVASLNAFGWQHWTVEQKWTSMILFLLLFFYNPLHPMVYLLPGWIPQALDNFFQISFFTYLLLFWICVFDALRAAEKSCHCFFCLRLLLTTTIWLLFVISNGWILHSEYRDPLFNISQHPISIKVFLAFFGVLAFVYLLFFFVHLFRSYSELKAMPYYGSRLTLLLIPILLTATNFLVILGMRFDPSGPVFYLHPPTTDVVNLGNTISNATNQRPFTPSGAAFPTFRSALELSLSFGVVFNFSSLMAIAYSPTKTALAEANYRDDPSVSLAYESDEDVLYGSDRDDIKLRRTIRSR